MSNSVRPRFPASLVLACCPVALVGSLLCPFDAWFSALKRCIMGMYIDLLLVQTKGCSSRASYGYLRRIAQHSCGPSLWSMLLLLLYSQQHTDHLHAKHLLAENRCYTIRVLYQTAAYRPA